MLYYPIRLPVAQRFSQSGGLRPAIGKVGFDPVEQAVQSALEATVVQKQLTQVVESGLDVVAEEAP
jgi:hypothetical protein